MADPSTLPMPTPTVPNRPLPTFKSLSFDIYGTLIDWETSILNLCEPLINAVPDNSPYKSALTNKSARQALLVQFNNEEAAVQTAHPTMVYDKLLAETYLGLARNIGVPINDSVEADAVQFGKSVGEWTAFPDTVDAMQRLGKYYKLVPLSNVDRASFQRTREGPLAAVPFWRWYLAQDIGSYKPNLRNFKYLLKHLDEDDKSEGGSGIALEQNLMVAQSLFHDHVPSKKIGMASVWIARQGAGMGMAGGKEGTEGLHERGEVGYGWRFATLGEFADEVERQWKEWEAK